MEKATFLTDDEKRAAVGYGPLPKPVVKNTRRRNTVKVRRGKRRKDFAFGDENEDSGKDNTGYLYDDNLDVGNTIYTGEPDEPIDSVYPIEEGIGALLGGEALGALGEAAGVGEGIGIASEDAEPLADQIANGHAYDKHVLEDGHFPGIDTPEQI